jgi:hypothetical protein
MRALFAEKMIMGLFDPVSITKGIHATPFPESRSIVIAYPQFEDWKKLYHPHSLRMPDANGIHRNVDAFGERYQNMKRGHETDVMRRLRNIASQGVGRAVLRELTRWRSYSVYILPYDFLPIWDWDMTAGAITEPIKIPQTAAERARDIKPAGTHVCEEGACYAAFMHAGKSVDVFFTSRRFHDSSLLDGVLLHELVHASRLVAGVLRPFPMGKGYANTEEFLATTIQNMYQSERNLPLYDYSWNRLNKALFFDAEQEAGAALYELRDSQRMLFDELASLRLDFNPVKVLYDEQRRVMTTNPYEAKH